MFSIQAFSNVWGGALHFWSVFAQNALSPSVSVFPSSSSSSRSSSSVGMGHEMGGEEDSAEWSQVNAEADKVSNSSVRGENPRATFAHRMSSKLGKTWLNAIRWTGFSAGW